MLKIVLISAGFILFNVHFIQAQLEEEINVVGLRLLDYDDNLPEDILCQRSVVFVSVPQKSSESSERGDWKGFSNQAHEYFKKIGIDAEVYFYLDDILSGPDPAAIYAKYLIDREIKYIIILSKVLFKVGSKIDTTHVMVISKFNGESSFISNGQKAWKDQNKDIDKIMKNIYRITVRREFKRTNNLIIDQPEFSEGINIVAVRKNENFPSDLRIDKIAIPKFTKYNLPSEIPNSPINNRILKEIEDSNNQVDRLNFKLDKAFQNYPWKYELVDYSVGEEQLFKDGFQFVLLRLNTSGHSMREMLGYELKPGESDYITIKKNEDGSVTFRSIPVEAPVYKFYIKQLARKEIYVGETWDADETWEDALQNCLKNILEKLRR